MSHSEFFPSIEPVLEEYRCLCKHIKSSLFYSNYGGGNLAEVKRSDKYLLALYHPEMPYKKMTDAARTESIIKGAELVKMIVAGTSYMDKNIENGHLYAMVLKFSYLSTTELSSSEVLSRLSLCDIVLSEKEFYRARKEAIAVLTSLILSKIDIQIINELVPWIDF